MNAMLASHHRFKYSAIDTRPKYRWPDGKSLALTIGLNAEHFPFGVAGGIDLDRETQPFSQRSWLWREYGNRVGGWRLAELFDELAVNVALIVNLANYEHSPELVARYRDRGDELIGHGLSNGTQRPIDMDEATERTMIRSVTETMLAADGVRPSGWLSPYLTPSLVTVDLLEEAGYEYVLDWGICDEQPFWVRARSGRILAIPYPIELNDQPAIVGRRHTAADYADMLVDQFDEMLRRSEDTPLVLSLSLHTFVVGQPFRIVHLRRALKHMLAERERLWLTLPREIARYYRTLPDELQLHAT